MRIMAVGAGKRIACATLACALLQSFILAYGAAPTCCVAGLHKVNGDIREVAAGDKLGRRADRTIHHGFAFKMTLKADAIALHWSEFGRVRNWPVPMLCDIPPLYVPQPTPPWRNGAPAFRLRTVICVVSYRSKISL